MQQMPLSQSYSEQVQDAVQKRACERSLAYFVRYVFANVYNLKWDNNWHHDEIIRVLTNLELRIIPNAIINMPPRYGKTELTTIMWIAHTLIRNPQARFIHASYADDLVKRNSDQIRMILAHPSMQKHWQIKMRASENSKGIWTTEQGGGLLAAPTGGQITGFGAGITNWTGDAFDGAIILDDPHKAGDADSEVMRNAVNELISGTLHSRKNHPRVPIVITMQRLNEEDATGYALAGKVMGDEFYHLKIPAIGSDGKALWHSKHTVEQLAAMEKAQPLTFAGQYQQEPYSRNGNVFNLNKCPRYSIREANNYYEQIVFSLDTAYKASEHNDPTCITVWGLTKTFDDLLEVENVRVEYPELRRLVLRFAEEHNPDTILIEDKASGQSLIQELRRETRLPIIAVNPVGDKLTRAHTASSYIDAERMRLPANAQWLSEFEKQLSYFPNAKHDDIVDSVSQFINWRKGKDGNEAHKQRLMKVLGRI